MISVAFAACTTSFFRDDMLSECFAPLHPHFSVESSIDNNFPVYQYSIQLLLCCTKVAQINQADFSKSTKHAHGSKRVPDVRSC